MTKGRAIGFAAVSSEAQLDDKISLDQQQTDIRAWCDREGYQLREMLIVPGHSRNFRSVEAMNRAMLNSGIDAIQRFIDHVEAQDFDVLVCRNIDRLGRSQGIISQMIEMVIEDAGAKIYTYAQGSSGWLDDVNAAMNIAIAGFMAATHKKGFSQLRDTGMRRRAELGFHVGMRAVPHFHRYTFQDGTEIKTPGADGQLYYLTVDRTYQRLFDDLYDVIVNEHTPYDSLETVMAKRGHLDALGKRYPYKFFPTKIWQPAFHGNMGFGGMGRRERWRIDPAYAGQIPPGVSVFYGVVEPVYIGDKATQFRNELYRRQEIVGKARPQHLTRFSGLAVCAECGYPLARSVSGDGKYEYYRCVTNSLGKTHYRSVKTCSQRKGIRSSDLQAYIDTWLRAFIAEPTAEFMAEIYAEDSQPAPRLDVELLEAIERRDVLIERMADPRMPPAALSATYKNLEAITDQIAALERQLAASKQTEALASNHLVIAHAALSELDIDALWTLDDTTINHFLHRVIDPLRIEVRDGKPTHFVTR